MSGWTRALVATFNPGWSRCAGRCVLLSICDQHRNNFSPGAGEDKSDATLCLHKYFYFLQSSSICSQDCMPALNSSASCRLQPPARPCTISDTIRMFSARTPWRWWHYGCTFHAIPASDSSVPCAPGHHRHLQRKRAPGAIPRHPYNLNNCSLSRLPTNNDTCRQGS